MRISVLLMALFWLGSPTLAQDSPQAPASESIQDRIRQGLSAAGEADAEGNLSIPLRSLGEADVSLDAPTSAARLRTTLDAVDIGQRIDKGLTAAGEATAFPPDFAFGAFQRGWFLTAFSLALERAERGDAPAQTLLGVLLSRGLGVKQDIAAAADWFSLAGKAGDAEALYALGRLHFEGQGMEQDFAAAAELFKQAADKGHAVAARELAYLLLEGKGQAQNAMLAAAYLRRAAALGDMDAQYTLGGLFIEGVGVGADETQAARWYAEAARNGHVGAQVEYAILLFNGRGVTRDEAVAAYWFRQAADADNPAAQVRLARLLSEGRGIGKDPAEAARWYLVARSRGAEDGFMEEFLSRLDAATLAAANEAAEEWTRLRPMSVAARPAGAGAPVDNSVE
jgi:TPR repeat protein